MFRDRGRTLLHVALAVERFWPEFGVSALRTTIRIPADSGEYARRLVGEIGLDGACVVEFRRDTAGRPRALEVNPRPSYGSSESIVRTGIDLPRMVFEWARGGRVEPVTRYPVGVRVGWLAADAARVAAACSLIHAYPRPPLAQSVRELLTDYLPGRAHPEGLDVSDPLPLFAAVPALARGMFGQTNRS